MQRILANAHSHPQWMMQGSDHALRYLSIHENNFIRYFRGHTEKVTSLGICPKSDLVMSTSQVRHNVQSGHCPVSIKVSALEYEGT